jgi:hypothetical protein
LKIYERYFFPSKNFFEIQGKIKNLFNKELEIMNNKVAPLLILLIIILILIGALLGATIKNRERMKRIEQNQKVQIV